MGRDAARIVNNFVHDMSTGTWAASVLVIWVLSRQSVGKPAEVVAAIGSAADTVFVLLVIALIGLAITGGIRLRYWRLEASPIELATKRRLLVGKHVAFFAVYGVGTVWAWSLL